MTFFKPDLWQRFQRFYTEYPGIGLAVDLSRMNLGDNFFADMQPRLEKALAAMKELENGAIANPDEKRMVGHYWLRNPALAPTPEIRREIEAALAEISQFVAEVHKGSTRGAKGPFRNLLLIGIGGSALGPQFVSNALSHPASDKLRLFTFDNTDPDGMDRVLAQLEGALGETICVVVSKSGGTKETRNGMLEAKAAFETHGLDFGTHTVAVTQAGSELDKFAIEHKWLKRFPMWDWVGGRTSELSAVGLLPAALQGFDVESLLAGARACDQVTRSANVRDNPAAQLAAAWFLSGNGNGSKEMVVLPYKDRLELISKYLQQLVMESLGKEVDLDGKTVNQGLTVFGNKGSTDQHAYVQQLRDGLSNFFVTFVQVLKQREGDSVEVEPGVTSGDYLNGFLLGTRQALFEKNRESLTITINAVSPFSIGVLIALFERAVGLYASLINVNAYHQPGVEAGKKAASAVIELQTKTLKLLQEADEKLTADQIAERIGADDVETIFRICESFAANPGREVQKFAGPSPFTATYQKR